jgi:predicted aconitase
MGEGLLHSPCARDLYFALVGLAVGERTGSRIPVLVGLPPDATEDELKALGAASASSGGVPLFHAVGITPEAATLEAALGDHRGVPVERIRAAELRALRDSLGSGRMGDMVTAVSLGTPHFSRNEFDQLLALLENHPDTFRADFYVNTSRAILDELEATGQRAVLTARSITVVVDTCTYLTPIMRNLSGVVMTNSGKMAHYAPSNLGVRIAYGSMDECVRSAVRGRVVFDG